MDRMRRHEAEIKKNSNDHAHDKNAWSLQGKTGQSKGYQNDRKTKRQTVAKNKISSCT